MQIKYTQIMEIGDIVSVRMTFHHIGPVPKADRKTHNEMVKTRVSAEIVAIDDIKEMVKLVPVEELSDRYTAINSNRWFTFREMDNDSIRIIAHVKPTERVLQEVHIHHHIYKTIFGKVWKSKTDTEIVKIRMI
tara:strand:+ start:2873 stop:3274 length:402 start_codon:yes stop_codon:yes gene_type:complete